jgi:WD40 repeat protein
VPALLALVRDGRRFIMAHKLAIEKSPLQVYVSALLFSPTGSTIRNLFKREEPEWMTFKPAMDEEWSRCLQTLEGHSGPVKLVAFSHDSARLALASSDSTVKIWDTGSGECMQTLKVGKALKRIAFNTTGLYLLTDLSAIAIQSSSAIVPSTNTTPYPSYQGGGLSADLTRITYNSENVLWLPTDYRPCCSAVLRKMIGAGVGSGRVWMCCFNG